MASLFPTKVQFLILGPAALEGLQGAKAVK